MTAVIVDTDVASFLFKEDTRAELYKPHLIQVVASISFMTLAELEQWAIVHKWGARQRGELLQFIRSQFVVIDSTAALCRKWAEVRGTASEQDDRLKLQTHGLQQQPLFIKFR
jgi:tRNA(fMet)-specific endonuclease VapC